MDLKTQYKRDLALVGKTSTYVAEQLGINLSSLYRSLGRKMSFERMYEIWTAMGFEIRVYYVGKDGKGHAKPLFDKDLL